MIAWYKESIGHIIGLLQKNSASAAGAFPKLLHVALGLKHVGDIAQGKDSSVGETERDVLVDLAGVSCQVAQLFERESDAITFLWQHLTVAAVEILPNASRDVMVAVGRGVGVENKHVLVREDSLGLIQRRRRASLDFIPDLLSAFFDAGKNESQLLPFLQGEDRGDGIFSKGPFRDVDGMNDIHGIADYVKVGVARESKGIFGHLDEGSEWREDFEDFWL